MRSLLDVNVLLALFDRDHLDHERAREWLEREIRHGWASCALTENGFVRILSQPRYPSPVEPAEAIRRLRNATGTEHHEFWASSISIVDETRVDARRLQGHRQVSDVYLLALAVERGGRLVTIDRAIPLEAVPGADADRLVVL